MQPLPIPETLPADLDHVGLIAGEGQFPILLARAARDRNIPVTAIGIRGVTNPELAEVVGAIHWVEFGQFNRMIELCHESGISKALMAGRIRHQSIFQLGKIDRRGIKLLTRLRSRKADAVLGAITAELASERIEVLDSTLFLRDSMPPTGLLTPDCPPGDEVRDDIEFGRPIADKIAGLDVGQTIVVKQLTVVAVEAMEGTNEAILRAGQIAGPGCVVIKVSKPRQDKRFDVPVIGLTTINKMIQARCAALAIPGGRTLFFDRDEACARAAASGISILAW